MNTNVIILAASIAAAFYLAKQQNAKTAGPVAPTRAYTLMGPIFDKLLGKSTSSTGNLIPNTALPGQPGWGWTYYDSGVSIGPDGTYYVAGNAVYTP